MFGRNNAQSLSRRDPAAAVLLGAISGSDFGVERRKGSAQFGTEFGTEFGNASNPWGHDPGYNFGFDHYGAEGAASQAAAVVPQATPQAMLAAWQHQNRQHMVNAKRTVLLEPNAGASTKVERYAFPISQAIVIGTPVAINLQGNPSVHIRPQRVVMNAPSPNYVYLTLIQVANVVVTVGPGVQDAWDYAAEAVGTSLDLPTLSPANQARVQGNYLGFIPPGYVEGADSFFVATFMGWASIVA
jgi:hypothetical protein